MIPKPKRQKDKKYLKYIEQQPCLCKSHECFGDVVAHHTTTKGAGGSDYLTVPLCGFHHAKLHNIGKLTFQQRFNVDFRDEIIRLLSKYVAQPKEG